MIKQAPNKQNERFWYPIDPEIELECRVQGGLKVMAWAGLVNGKVIRKDFHLMIPKHLFNFGVTYYNKFNGDPDVATIQANQNLALIPI